MLVCTRRGLLGVVGAAELALTRSSKPVMAASAQPYHLRVLAKHPAAYWRFEERSGPKAIDGTGQGHDGVYQGSVALRRRGAIRSEPDAAIGLNGVDSFVEMPDSQVFSQPTSGHGLTVEAWIRPDALTFQGQTDEHYVHWLGKGQEGAFEWGFRFYSKTSSRPNRISAYIWNVTSPPHVPNEGAGAYFQDSLQSGTWIHVVACFDPGDAGNPSAGVSIYKNGMLRGSPATSPGARYATYNIHPVHGSAPLRLGTRDGGSFLQGALDEVAIYPRVLTSSEVRDNYIAA